MKSLYFIRISTNPPKKRRVQHTALYKKVDSCPRRMQKLVALLQKKTTTTTGILLLLGVYKKSKSVYQ